MVKLLIIFVLVLFVSCQEPLGIERNVDKSIIEKELFPLSEGNKWHYTETIFNSSNQEVSEMEYVINVQSTHITKGKLWYQINKSSEPSLEHFYSYSDDGLWYRVPNYFPSDNFLVLNYQTDENDKLVHKDFYRMSLSEKCDIEVILVNKNHKIEINSVDFDCYQYNLYRIYKDSNQKYLFKEQFYAKGVGLVKEIEYDEYNGNIYLKAERRLSIYKVN